MSDDWTRLGLVCPKLHSQASLWVVLHLLEGHDLVQVTKMAEREGKSTAPSGIQIQLQSKYWSTTTTALVVRTYTLKFTKRHPGPLKPLWGWKSPTIPKCLAWQRGIRCIEKARVSKIIEGFPVNIFFQQKLILSLLSCFSLEQRAQMLTKFYLSTLNSSSCSLSS